MAATDVRMGAIVPVQKVDVLCEGASAVKRKATSLEATMKDLFEGGVWNQHLANQNTSGAAVQGVRFYYIPLPSDTEAVPQAISPVELLKGANGYVTVLPDTARLDSDPSNRTVFVSLESMKSKLVAGKAWESNRKSFCALRNKVVAVILMQRGRPRDRRFGAGDALLGLFRVELIDEASLSCRLHPCAVEGAEEKHWDLASCWAHVEDCFGGKDSRSLKRRRRELPTFSTMGCIMGEASDTAFTGPHCKDLWIRALQAATCSIRINAFCIGDADILESLRKAAAPPRSLPTRIRYDARQQGRTYGGCFEEERFRTIDVHPIVASDDEKQCMHKKELIVDAELPEKACLLLGSFNPTQNARANQESLFAVRVPEVVQSFAERFDADWAVEKANFLRDAAPGHPQRVAALCAAPVEEDTGARSSCEQASP